MGYSPWGCKESDMTKHARTHLLKRLCHFAIPPRVNEYYYVFTHSPLHCGLRMLFLGILCMLTNVFFTQADETGMTVPYSQTGHAPPG